MISTVVGSFPAEIKSPTTAKDKILNVFGAYDPFKESIKQTVISQLDAGVDIISDGQVRGDMVSTFTNFIPGMQLEDNNTVITSKIRQPTKEISIDDLKYAKKVMNDYFNGNIPVGVDFTGASSDGESVNYVGLEGGYAWFVAPNIAVTPKVRYNIATKDTYESAFQGLIGFSLFF